MLNYHFFFDLNNIESYYATILSNYNLIIKRGYLIGYTSLFLVTTIIGGYFPFCVFKECYEKEKNGIVDKES